MTGDSKFFVAVGIVAVLVIGAVLFFSGETKPVAFSDIDTTVGHKKGPDTAMVKIVEFADYSCPACATVPPVMAEVLTNNPENVQVIFRHFPLPGNVNSIPAAKAAEAAALQGKFWEMSNLLFTQQQEWVRLDDPFPSFSQYAEQIGLDLERFRSDFNSDQVLESVIRDRDYGSQLGVDRTPFFVINGQAFPGNRSVADWQNLIDAAIRDAS